MNNRVPIPTDNIYKFYALFGLALLITSVFAFLSVYNSHRAMAYEIYQEVELLKKIAEPTNEQSIRLEILISKSEIDAKNKKFYMSVVGLMFGLSLSLMFIGFLAWHLKIQPLQDKLKERELEKIELEIKLLKQEKHVPFRRTLTNN